MLKSFGGNLFRGLYVCVILGTFAVPTKSDEIQMNTATVIFSEVTISSWNSDGKTAKLKEVVAAVANGYCARNYDNCALRFWNTTRTFRNSDVTIASNFPKQVKKDLEIRFYVVLPSGDDIRKPNSTVLPKGTLDSILATNSSQIGAAVNAQVKRKSDGSTSKPKSDDTMDYIMIPVGFGLLIFVIVLACCLHFCHKRKLEQIKKEERRQFLLQQKSGSSKPQSPFQAPPVKQIPEVAVKPQQRQEPRFYYENEQDSDQEVNKRENKTPIKDKDPDKREDDEQSDNLYDNVNGSYINKECKENVRAEEEEVSEERDHEKRNSKRRKKKKKRRHKKHNGSPKHEYDEESGSDEDIISPPPVVEDEDISSRLPPPRKLPPLRGQTTKL